MMNSDGGTTWNYEYFGDGVWTWEKEYDPCPAGWRVPHDSDYMNLYYTSSFWGELNGVPGRFFGTDQKLFFPAAGFRGHYGVLTRVGTYGNYWGCRRSGTYSAIGLYFFDSFVGIDNNMGEFGLSVRCVAE
jgi:uncharacterized protein (TIGR02145 family)